MKSLKIAYIVLVILIGLLVFCTYIKMTYVKVEEDVVVETKSVSLGEIANNYNNKKSDVDLKATIDGTKLHVAYGVEVYTFDFNNGVLKSETSADMTADKMFVNLVDAVVMAKEGKENESVITTNLIIYSLFSNDSVKVVKDGNAVMYVIDTSKDFTFYKAKNIYNEVKIFNINENDYNIDMNGIQLISPVFKYSEEKKSFDVKAYIENPNKNTGTVNIVLYDNEKNKLKETSFDVKANSIILTSSIELGDLTEDDVIYCSFEIN